MTFSIDYYFASCVFLIGAYCMIVSRNLIKQLIGLEIISKSALIFLISSGFLTNKTNLAQSLIVVIILVEVVIVATGLSLIVKNYNLNKTLDIKKLNNLKG